MQTKKGKGKGKAAELKKDTMDDCDLVCYEEFDLEGFECTESEWEPAETPEQWETLDDRVAAHYYQYYQSLQPLQSLQSLQSPESLESLEELLLQQLPLVFPVEGIKWGQNQATCRRRRRRRRIASCTSAPTGLAKLALSANSSDAGSSCKPVAGAPDQPCRPW